MGKKLTKEEWENHGLTYVKAINEALLAEEKKSAEAAGMTIEEWRKLMAEDDPDLNR